MPRYIGTCFRFYTQMRVEKNPKAFAYRVPIGDYNYLQCGPILENLETKLSSRNFSQKTNEQICFSTL